MQISRKVLRVGAVLAVAATIGHLMQNGGAIAARLGIGSANAHVGAGIAPDRPQTRVADLSMPGQGDAAGLAFGRDAAPVGMPRASQPLAAPAPILAALDAGGIVAPPAIAAPLPAADCAPQLSLGTAPAAMIELVLTAACNPGAEVTLTHAGLTFRQKTDAAGRLALAVPALQSPAVLAAAVPGQAPVAARIAVPDLAGYDRVAVTWAGPAEVELHAFETGAGYGSAGHLWRGNPRRPDVAAGFVLTLGDAAAADPRRAEIVSFPAGAAGEIRLTVEAEVTAAACGTTVAAESLSVTGGGRPSGSVLTLAMPDCDAIGDYLVLNNLFDDLKIAAR